MLCSGSGNLCYQVHADMRMQSPAAQNRVARILANVLLLLLAIYSGVALAKITWLIAWNDKPVPVVPVSVGGSVTASGQVYPMASYEFFGRPPEQVGVAEAVKRSAPETRLRLRLEGVLVGQRPEDSGAIVAGSNGETEYYRVGETLPGNAELAEVESDRILIRRGGRYESLAFEEQLDSSVMVADAPVQAAESPDDFLAGARQQDRKSTRLNSSHVRISYAVFCLKK